jgi:hypothetical protein
MNERILELAKQAGHRYYPSSNSGPLRVEYLTPELEKFAELIVRECAELIDNKVTITAAQTYDEVFVAKFDTKELCAKQIREHFGVEE